jgi:hypothetical protein
LCTVFLPLVAKALQSAAERGAGTVESGAGTARGG